MNLQTDIFLSLLHAVSVSGPQLIFNVLPPPSPFQHPSQDQSSIYFLASQTRGGFVLRSFILKAKVFLFILFGIRAGGLLLRMERENVSVEGKRSGNEGGGSLAVSRLCRTCLCPVSSYPSFLLLGWLSSITLPRKAVAVQTYLKCLIWFIVQPMARVMCSLCQSECKNVRRFFFCVDCSRSQHVLLAQHQRPCRDFSL